VLASGSVTADLNPFLKRYADVSTAWKSEFDRNLARHGARIHCRKGCAYCCHHLFQITEVEAAVISRAVKQMPAEEREDVQARARAYLPRREQIMRRHGMIEAWGNLPPEGTRLACPALADDGACRIYEHRPMVCRKFGIPLSNPQKPGRVFACELNFQPGDEIEDNQLIRIQTGLYDAWKSVQEDYNDAGGRRDDSPVTVARALLEDFEEHLPRLRKRGGPVVE